MSEFDINPDVMEVLTRAYLWLDYDKDGVVSFEDLKSSSGITDNSEALLIFEALKPEDELYITFNDFSKGVMEFPYLLSQFSKNFDLAEPERASNNTPEVLYDTARSLSIINPESKNTEELLELISVTLVDEKSFRSKALKEAAKCLLTWGRQMKELADSLVSELKSKDFEHAIQQESLKREKERVDASYASLILEHSGLEGVFKELQQAHLQLKHELRERKLKYSHLEAQNDSLLQTMDDLKALVTQKDKSINELTKKLKVTTALSVIKDIPRQDSIKTPRSALSKPIRIEQCATTPKSASKKALFDIDSESIKDQVIKNLKAQLYEGFGKIQELEQQISEVDSKNKEFVDKIKEFHYNNCKMQEDEDDSFRLSNLASLKDEIAMVDVEYALSSRYSVKPKANMKEIGIQYEWDLKRKKARWSCFSIFD